MKRFATIGIKIQSVNKVANSLRAVFSTSDMDRHGDIVVQNWDLSNFKANPVIINSHNYGDATEVIGRAIAIEVIDGQLVGDIEFAVKENPKAQVIYDLYAGEFLHAFSVGFIPLEFDAEGKIVKSELLEVSAVSVPANAMALAKQKGVDVAAIEADVKAETEPEEDEDEDPDGDEDIAEEVKQIVDDALPADEPRHKAGAVLSRKSRTLVSQARDALQELLDHADAASNEGKGKGIPALKPKQTKDQMIQKLASKLGEELKVESRAKRDRANDTPKRNLNRIIRMLVKSKVNL